MGVRYALLHSSSPPGNTGLLDHCQALNYVKGLTRKQERVNGGLQRLPFLNLNYK